MAAGTSRQVTFQVTIDDVTGAAGETVAVDILNAGAVQSDRTPTTPSNQVVTPVSKVLPVKVLQAAGRGAAAHRCALPVGPTGGWGDRPARAGSAAAGGRSPAQLDLPQLAR